MNTAQIDSKAERMEVRVHPEANKIINEGTLIELSLADQTLFIESLVSVAEPNKRLMDAAKRYKQKNNIDEAL